MEKCKYCGKEFSKMGISTHIWRMHGEGINFHPSKGWPKIPWNKGLTKETSEKVNQYSISLTGKSTGKASTPEKEIERKRKISETMILRRVGGYRKGSGRGKKGRYKGIWCDSSWELAWVIFHLEHNIKFERNWKKFTYEFENKQYSYIPDFILEDNIFIEIKGRRKFEDLTKREITKISVFKETHNLNVLLEQEMQDILKYTKEKYGDNFISLYE